MVLSGDRDLVASPFGDDASLIPAKSSLRRTSRALLLFVWNVCVISGRGSSSDDTYVVTAEFDVGQANPDIT